MNLLKSFILFLFLVSANQIVHARSITDAEKQALVSTINTFKEAIQKMDGERIAETLSPKYMRQIATMAGTSETEARARFAETASKSSSAVTLNSFTVDIAAATFGEGIGGTPYVLIPSETMITTDINQVIVNSHVFALMEEGKWYLMDVSAPQQRAIFNQVYPEFVNVQIPPPVTKTAPKP